MIKGFFGRLADAALKAAPIGSLLGFILFYMTVLAAELLRVELSPSLVIGAAVVLHVFSLTAMTVHTLIRGSHKYDQDIVGSNFLGLSRKSRLFAQAQELHFNRRINSALSLFKQLESEYADKLTQSEKAIVSFYIARCYDLMRYYPNALINYERAGDSGFDNPVLPFLKARCTGANGDTDEAVSLYSEVLEDVSSPFCNLVRNDIGRMYLDKNEPEKALEWYGQAIEKRESYPEALGGAAIANVMLGDVNTGEQLYRQALVNHIKDSAGFTEYYRKILAAEMKRKETERQLSKLGRNDNE